VIALDTELAHHDNLAHLEDLDDEQANGCAHDLALVLSGSQTARNLVDVPLDSDGVDLPCAGRPGRQHSDPGSRELLVGAQTEAVEGYPVHRDLVVLRGPACWAAATWLCLSV
jgi:hypothetical protein